MFNIKNEKGKKNRDILSINNAVSFPGQHLIRVSLVVDRKDGLFVCAMS